MDILIILVVIMIIAGLSPTIMEFLSNMKKTKIYTMVNHWRKGINKYYFAGTGGAIDYQGVTWRSQPYYDEKGKFVMHLEGVETSIKINDNLQDPQCDIRIVPDVHGLNNRIYCRVDGQGIRREWNNILVDSHDNYAHRAVDDAKQLVSTNALHDAMLKEKIEGDKLDPIIKVRKK